MDLYDIENILLRLEKKIDDLERKFAGLAAKVNFPQGNIAQVSNGDQTKFSSGSIQGATDGASRMKPEVKR